MKEFRSIFKQDFADYIETNQGTISNEYLAEHTQRIAYVRFPVGKRKHWRNLGSDCKPMDQETPSGQCTQDRQ